MILEAAILKVETGSEEGFERAFAESSRILASTGGREGRELHRRVETEGKYMLLVGWQTLEGHTEGFRGSPKRGEWKRLLRHFCGCFPTVEHFTRLYPERTQTGGA